MMTGITLIQVAVSKVFSDLVSKAISDGVDISIKGIKEADQNRKSYSQNLQTQLYHVIIDALNEFTYDKYKKQDKLYDAAESILKGFKSNNKDSAEAMKSGLKILVSCVNSDTCQDFLETLCCEICKVENSGLYKEMDMLWKKQEKEYIHGVFEKSNQNDREILEKLNDFKEVLDYIKEMMNRREDYGAGSHGEIPIENRAEEYASKWDKNVFLNDFNEEDENAGVNIKLGDIYKEICLPHYIWKTNTKPSDKLRNLLTKYIVDNDGKKMLLILGQPGIGKSTLITWIMANLVEKQNNIYVYQFASDLKNINWQDGNILSKILKTLGLGYEELENKSLILDGFDEIYANTDRERILNKLNQELEEMNILKRFSLIITCRENYVYKVNEIECDYITLLTWDDNQIKCFCEIYGEKSASTMPKTKIDKLLKSKEVFGIPLILYMVLALNIAIEENASLIDIYDQIFSLDRSSIYDRCIKNSRFGQAHRISEFRIKQQIHRISQRIAFWIFENNSDKAFISQEKFEEICENEMNELGEKVEETQRDALIGNFFKLNHCEGKGTDELQFMHRSIYEYFVVVYFFESIQKMKSKEEVAGKLGELLKYGRLSEQILEFIKYKFDNMKEYKLSDITREIFTIMLRDGMTYYVEGKYMNIIDREMNIFSNMLEVVHLWNPKLGKFDNIVSYLQYNFRNTLNLSGVDLSGADLNRADLNGADLSGADLNRAHLVYSQLKGANLSGANLSGVDLDRADLGNADLSGANLSRAYLGGADLNGANLSEANLSRAHLDGADLSGTIFDKDQVNLLSKGYDLTNIRVYISKTEEIISYNEYCKGKQKT